MIRNRHKVKILWDQDSRESDNITYTLWIVRNLIQLGVGKIQIESLIDQSPSKKKVESIIGKVGEPIKRLKDKKPSAKYGRNEGETRFSPKHISNNKKND